MNEALKRVSNEALINTFAVLTHRLHVADRDPGSRSVMLALNIRDQRGQVEEEMLRRMNGTR